jgi:hypothetical protein
MRYAILILAALTILALASPVQARMAATCSTKASPKIELRCGHKNLHHARAVLGFLQTHPGAGSTRDRAVLHRDMTWLKKYAKHHISNAQYRMWSGSLNYWIKRQIWAATLIGSASHANGGDPWPNCPDPFDGGGGWQDTVNCENHGNWYDSPGFYRCGLQFDPGWEHKYGRLCP